MKPGNPYQHVEGANSGRTEGFFKMRRERIRAPLPGVPFFAWLTRESSETNRSGGKR